MTPRRLLIVGVLMCVVCTACSAFGFGNKVAVTMAEFDANNPSTVHLGVASCNGAPEAVLTELAPGEYRVEARTTQSWNRGEECLDIVTVVVAKNLNQFTIEDAVGGEVFSFPPPDQFVDTADIDGSWEMTQVDGDPVEIGINTAEVPNLDIDAGYLSGNFGCNSGGAELLQEGSTLSAPLIESEQELCSVPDGGEEMVPTERILVDMLESEEGVMVEVVGEQMTWTQGSHKLVFKRSS